MLLLPHDLLLAQSEHLLQLLGTGKGHIGLQMVAIHGISLGEEIASLLYQTKPGAKNSEVELRAPVRAKKMICHFNLIYYLSLTIVLKIIFWDFNEQL